MAQSPRLVAAASRLAPPTISDTLDSMKKVLPVALCLFLMVLARTPLAVAENSTMPCDLGPLLDIPAVWSLTPEKLEQLYPKPQRASANPYFTWLTADHS